MYRSIKALNTRISRFKLTIFSLPKLFLFLLLSLFAFIVPKLYANDAQIIETLPNGLIIELNITELNSKTEEINGETFNSISFENCYFTNDNYMPKIPFCSAIIGIPDQSSPTISILSSNYNLMNDYKLPIFEDTDSDQSSPNISKNDGFYPSNLAKVTPLGYMRQQRLARLELYPVQYNQLTSQLRFYKRLSVKVIFNNSSSSSIQSFDSVYEDIYKDALLNYEQAKKWRIPKAKTDEINLAPSALQQPSGTQALSYKMTINKNGIYRLDYNYLRSNGIDPSAIDPRKIEIKTGGNEVPIYVEGYQDGTFDPEDYIEFYGTKMNSIYTNNNVYWLAWATKENPNVKSWMMAVKDGSPVTSNLKVPTSFMTTDHFEMDRDYDPLKKVNSETVDHFFWKPFRGQDPKNNQTEPIAIDLPYRASNLANPATIRICFQGITYAKGASNHIMKIYLNSELLDTARWEGPNEYIIETKIRQDAVYRSNWIVIECGDNNGTQDDSDPKWDAYLNWIEVDYWREFATNTDSLEFSTETVPSVTRNAVFSVSNFSRNEIEFFQIDQTGAIAKIINPKIEKVGVKYTASFEDSVTQPTRYIAVSSSSIMKPISIVKDESSTLHNPANNIDYIIITHKNFISSAERLANFRQQQGLAVLIVDIDDIYDEFSYGIFDPRAIKRFLRYAYFNWAKMPTYVLLIGDAHWDYKYVYDEYYKKYETYPRIYVPTYHAPSSPYGETAMDDRFVEISGDDVIPDMLIGRMPVDSLDEADSIVDKTIEYETKPKYGLWQSRIMLVADDELSKSGDEIFEDSRKTIAESFIPVGYEVLDVYLRKLKEPYLAENAIIKGINNGLLLLEYSGHGGAQHWAHEDIFNMSSLTKLKNTLYPVVITTTCENGYFDNPQGAKKTLIDQMLMQENSGAVACFSATRLTYGQGNAVFDQKLYPRLFSTKPPTIGKIMNLSKIDFIKLDISAWTSTVEQYIIFGDPALRIALPEQRIDCELEKSSVSKASKIDLKIGYVKRPKSDVIVNESSWANNTDFSGQMRISLVYPNNFDDNDLNDLPIQVENAKITNGVFENISVNIPNDVNSGKTYLRFFAYNNAASAIGGVKFSISEPIIEQNISKIINDESLQIYIAVTDNLGQGGIKSIVCDWRNTETWVEHTTIMKPGEAPSNAPKIEGTWYTLGEIIQLSKPGTKIDYKVIISDTEGNETQTEYQSVKVPIGVNLAIPRLTFFTPPEITYAYSKTLESWTLTVPVENNGSKEVKAPIGVYFFEGNPDRNGDQVVDQGANLLGNTIINYEQWENGNDEEGTPIQKTIVTAKLSKPLYTGIHQIFVWVNPEINPSQGIPLVEVVEDADGIDNIGSKLFQINEFLVGKGDSDTYAQSLDEALKIVIPNGSIAETIMSITRLTAPEVKWKQVDVEYAPIPADDTDGNAFKIQVSSGDVSLKKESTIDIKFDITRLREIAKKTKGLDTKSESQLTYTEREWIDIATQEEAKKLGVYIWQENLGVWKRLPSELLSNTEDHNFLNDYYFTIPVTDNKSSASFEGSTIKVDEISTPIGNWIILFLDSERYRMFLRREGRDYYESLNRYGEVDSIYDNIDIGLQITMYKGEKDFSFGDIFKFDTYRDLDGTIKLKNMKGFNDGDGTIHLSMMDKNEQFVYQMYGSWVIFFIDSKNYEIHSKYGDPVLDDFGEALIGTIGKELYVSSIGLKIEISEGKYPFEFGDKFVFDTLFAGIVRAEVSQMGTFTLMRSNDNIQPNVELWVNGQIPKSGAVIPPRPTMSLMLSDVNGIDMNTLSFMVSVNDREFHQVPRSDYVLSERSQLDSIPIFYSPILNIGKYKYRISVGDFNGNISKSGNGDYLEFMFLVEQKPDMTSPVITVAIDGMILTDGEIYHKSPTFNISINDDHAIEKSQIIISMATLGDALTPIDANDYSISISDDLKNANIVYSPQLMNGDYIIQVQAADTSKNFAYLSPPELDPIKFTVDEKVEVRDIINAPNPFSDTTVFSYYLTQPATETIVKIYTLRGKLIRTLKQDLPSWKYNEIYWDGRDEDDIKVASGVYFYKLTVNNDNKKIEKISKLAIIR